MPLRRGVLSVGIGLTLLSLAGPVYAQLLSSTQVSTQTSIGVSCVEPGCDCFVNGLPDICPGTNTQNYDSGAVAGASSHTYSPTASGQFVGFDSHSSVDASVNGNATFGTLHAYASSSSTAFGAYALAGGLVIPVTSDAYTSTAFSDQLTVTGPPGLAVSITFTQSISAFISTTVGSGSGVNPCLANAAAYVLLNSTISASSLFTSASGLAQYSRFGRVGGVDNGCVPLQSNGNPINAITLNLHVGDKVNFYESLQVSSRVRMDGGLGLPTNPNRVLDGDSVLDASNSAKVYVDVLTPGASYSTASGTVYPAPEPETALSLATSVVGLAVLASRRRSR